jgi:hypothetical protein
MLATRCACGFEALADEDLNDHLQAVFEPEDSTGADGQAHLEQAARTCSCGFPAASPAELDAHFIAAFTPADSIGSDGAKHAALP